MEPFLSPTEVRYAEGDRWLYLEDVPPIACAPRAIEDLKMVGVPQLMKLYTNIRKSKPAFAWTPEERRGLDLSQAFEFIDTEERYTASERPRAREEGFAIARAWARPVARYLRLWDETHAFVPHEHHVLAHKAENSIEGVQVLTDALLELNLIPNPPRKRRRAKVDQALEDFKARHRLLCRAHIWALHELRLPVNRRRLPGTHRSVLSANMGCQLTAGAHYKERCDQPLLCTNLTEYGP